METDHREEKQSNITETDNATPVIGSVSTSFAARRKSAQHLAPLILSKNLHAPKCTPEEMHLAQAEGTDAYGVFLRNRLLREALQEPEELSVVVEYHKNAATTALMTARSTSHSFDEMSPISTPLGAKFPQWSKAGRKLDQLAVSFERTEERRKVKQQAQVIADETDITKEKFVELLANLFSEGKVTTHRIVVLFVFCSDVVITTLRKKGDKLLTDFLHWIFDFISDRVCSWVAENGGWEAVLSSTGAWIAAGLKLVAAGFLIYLGVQLAKKTVESITSK